VGEQEILRLVIFAACGGRFGIALDSIDRVVRMVAISPLPGAPAAVIGAVNVGGQVVAVADVCRRLGLAAPRYGPESHLILARTARRRLAITAHEVQGVVEVRTDAMTRADAFTPVRTVSLPPGRVAGAVGLPDGIVFIKDLEAFFSAEEEDRLDLALERDA
jgi:purine-binding chemotaxis protein CheW